MESRKSESEFYWSFENEPHTTRRKEILQAHPEVRSLFGIDQSLKYWTIILVFLHLGIATLSHTLDWYIFIPLAYFFGATMIQALFLAIHEITHDLAFNRKSYNNWLAFIGNIPMIVPYAMAFKYYHALHHWNQGKDGEDTDIASKIEATYFKGTVGKLFWFLLQIFFYAFRPMFTKPLKIDRWVILNFIFQFIFISLYFYIIYFFIHLDAVIYALLYLFISLVFAGGLHPTAGHFISEHYIFKEGQETYSYYGKLNLITFNVGYHNEHHDFPQIPGRRLPLLKKAAPEFYDSLLSYNSWIGVSWKFIFDKHINLFSRVKRK